MEGALSSLLLSTVPFAVDSHDSVLNARGSYWVEQLFTLACLGYLIVSVHTIPDNHVILQMYGF